MDQHKFPGREEVNKVDTFPEERDFGPVGIFIPLEGRVDSMQTLLGLAASTGHLPIKIGLDHHDEDGLTVRAVQMDQIGLLDLEERLEHLGHLNVDGRNEVISQSTRDWREGIIDAWLSDGNNLEAAFRAIPSDWLCVADCPSKELFVSVYLYERYGAIDLAMNGLDTGKEVTD